MAKISARGDTEAKRWRRGDGAELVLTKHGRLLHKAVGGGSFTLLMSKVTPEMAEAQAAERGMVAPNIATAEGRRRLAAAALHLYAANRRERIARGVTAERRAELNAEVRAADELVAGLRDGSMSLDPTAAKSVRTVIVDDEDGTSWDFA